MYTVRPPLPSNWEQLIFSSFFLLQILFSEESWHEKSALTRPYIHNWFWFTSLWPVCQQINHLKKQDWVGLEQFQKGDKKEKERERERPLKCKNKVWHFGVWHATSCLSWQNSGVSAKARTEMAHLAWHPILFINPTNIRDGMGETL